MTKEELNKLMADHKLWINGDSDGVKADLRGANLIGADLSGADLRKANLRGANLIGAYLSGADLRGADLYKANLRGANLIGADLSGADLSGADLRGADLYKANLREANLREANLRAVDLSGANLRKADLLCVGNMVELKTMQFDEWMIGYTHDTLQIGCQRHPIEKWSKWSTKDGREWVSRMDDGALDWANKYLDLVLTIIEKSPAKGQNDD